MGSVKLENPEACLDGAGTVFFLAVTGQGNRFRALPRGWQAQGEPNWSKRFMARNPLPAGRSIFWAIAFIVPCRIIR